MPEPNEAPQILVVRGTPFTLEVAANILSQLDVEVGFVAPEQHEQIDNVFEVFDREGYYRFSEINSPNQWLGREHVLAFQRLYAPEYDKKTASQVFSAIVDPAIRSKVRSQHANYRPIDPEFITKSTGLILDSRKQVGFPPLSPIHISASTPPGSIKKVVQVGSLLKFHNLLNTDHALSDRLHTLHNPDSSKRKFLHKLIDQLNTQLVG